MDKVKIFFQSAFIVVEQTWDSLPREFKVFGYLVAAAIIDQAIQAINPETLSFIPIAYRIAAFNLIIVFLTQLKGRVLTVKTKLNK